MISRCFDTAEVGEIRANRVVTAEFKSTEALGSQNSPQLSFLVRGLGTKPSPTISRAFIFGHCNRAPPKARRQRTLSRRPEARRRSPLSGGDAQKVRTRKMYKLQGAARRFAATKIRRK